MGGGSFATPVRTLVAGHRRPPGRDIYSVGVFDSALSEPTFSFYFHAVLYLIMFLFLFGFVLFVSFFRFCNTSQDLHSKMTERALIALASASVVAHGLVLLRSPKPNA